MRILVADQNALLLAAIASTFGRHCVLVTATRRETCLEHLSQEPFDVVVACEKLRDYTGLELLSEIESIAPQTLCIFSAPAPRLAQLQSRLDHFRLLGTLSYPIEPRKLLVALKVARTKLPSRAAPPKVRHVVLESEWDTGERLGILERELEVEPAEPPTLSAAPTRAPVNVPPASPFRTRPARKNSNTPTTGPARKRASIPVANIPVVAPTTRKPERAPPIASAAAGSDDIPILDNVEETSVSPVRWVNKSPSAEGSYEVSFDENPHRFKATAATVPVTSTPARAPAATPQVTSTGSRAAAAPGSGPTQKPSRPPNVPTGAEPSTSPGHSGSPGHSAPKARSSATVHAISPDRSPRSAPRLVHSGSAGQPELASDPNDEETLETSFDVMAATLGAPANDPSVEPPPPPPPPPVDTGGAANEPAFDSDKAGKNSDKTPPGQSDGGEAVLQKSSAEKSESGNSGSKPAAGEANPKSPAAKTPSGTATQKATPVGPPQRKQAVPTAAQREAFQRAQSRRNAARNGFSIEADTYGPPSLQAGGTSGVPGDFQPNHSLTDLARMATNKRPLPQTQSKFAPKRNVVMVGSGVAAVVLASVLAFQLTRSHTPTHHNRQGTAQLFSSNANEVAQNNASDAGPQVFGPPPGQSERVAATATPTSNLPQPQTFDPNTAPADPPPPPALEHPGPMEPPSNDSE